MKYSDLLSARIDELCNNKDTLYYLDQYGSKIKVSVQPRDIIEKINDNQNTISKLKKNGVFGCLVIGNDEFGLPLVISTETQKTYLLDSDEMEKDEYLDYEVQVETK